MSDLSEAYYPPDGMRLMLGRALSSEVEVRLFTIWPGVPAIGRRWIADDYPQPDKASGYEPRVVRAGVWQIRTVDGGLVADAPMMIFRLTGQADAAEVAGYVLVDKTSGQLLGAGRFRRAVPIPDEGVLELEVVPRWFHPSITAVAG